MACLSDVRGASAVISAGYASPPDEMDSVRAGNSAPAGAGLRRRARTVDAAVETALGSMRTTRHGAVSIASATGRPRDV